MLSKDPTDIRISSFLNRVIPIRVGPGGEEGVVGETIQEGGLLDDLMNQVLDRGSTGVGDRVEVHGDDGDPVRELFHVLSCRAASRNLVNIADHLVNSLI